MKRYFLLIAFVASFSFNPKCIAQVVFNGDLEKIDPSTKRPVAWNNFMSTGYSYALDSSTVKHGKYAISISSANNDAAFGSISCVIPYAFKGHRIQLKGYIKTENVIGGYGGLWLRVDGTPAFDNMASQNIHGTTDWKEYTIDLAYESESAININAGALLVGKGKMWFDDLHLYLDGVPVEKAEMRPVQVFNAEKDTTFLQGSNINNATVNQQQIKDLALLCQVWGFIKYHLPKAAKGDLNMDAELFRVMPNVLNASNSKETSDAIEHWVDNLGVPEPCNSCKPFSDKNADQKPDYGDIFNKSVVNASLITKLNYILNNRNTGKSYYVDMAKGVGNPEFKHELPYMKMTYPDAGYRLLCLFRYWNMIQYFYPYKHLIGQDWNKVLVEFIPKYIQAKCDTDYEVTTLALISSIHDTHANIWSNLKPLNKYRGEYAPPFEARFVEGKLTVTGYYNDTLSVKDNFKIADVILKINGVEVPDLIKKYLPITAASNYETQLRDMPRYYLLRSNQQSFVFDIMRDGKMIKITQKGILNTQLNLASIYRSKVAEPGYHLIDNQIGYLYPGKYYNKDLSDIKKLFKNTKGIIIDMRCYPSEFMPFTFVPYIKTGDARFVKFTRGSIIDPGLFVVSDPLGIKASGDYQGKVVVIVNEISQSQAEYTTMAFQSSPNVTVIGSTTAGADGNVSSIMLPGGISTMISGIGILYPDGTETQRKGVKIDIEVKPTIEGIKAGKDELFEKAKALIAGS